MNDFYTSSVLPEPRPLSSEEWTKVLKLLKSIDDVRETMPTRIELRKDFFEELQRTLEPIMVEAAENAAGAIWGLPFTVTENPDAAPYSFHYDHDDEFRLIKHRVPRRPGVIDYTVSS